MHSVTIVEMPVHDAKYNLVFEFLKLRKEIFMDQMEWPLYSYDSIEFEQYDSFTAVYVIAHENGKVLGGARLLRTDSRLGTGRVKYSYMIRDAHAGLLPGMPTSICFDEPPSDHDIWELTRLATLPNTNVATDILNAANDYLARKGATQCLFLGPPAFLRMAKSLNYEPERLGPIVKNTDGSFLAFQCPIIKDRSRFGSGKPTVAIGFDRTPQSA